MVAAAARKNPVDPPFLDDDEFTPSQVIKLFIPFKSKPTIINMIKRGVLHGAYLPEDRGYITTYRSIREYLDKRRDALNGGYNKQQSLPLSAEQPKGAVRKKIKRGKTGQKNRPR